jgi:hypothetical protein
MPRLLRSWLLGWLAPGVLALRRELAAAGRREQGLVNQIAAQDRLIVSLADRVHKQSELLSRRAEK